VLRPQLWHSLLSDLGRRPEPAAVARFIDRCIISIRCLTDVHAQLPRIGLTLARFVELREGAWHAQYNAVAHDERPVADDETEAERLTSRRAAWRPDLEDALAPEMRAAVINLHLRGLDDDSIACSLDLPPQWPPQIIGRARLNPKARDVVRHHLAGASLAGLAKATGVPASSTLRILRLVDEVPHGAKERVDAAARARAIVRLREKEGLSYKEISERLGCSMDTVKNVLRRKRRPRYTKRKGAAE
jgi:hypothetical protein